MMLPSSGATLITYVLMFTSVRELELRACLLLAWAALLSLVFVVPAWQRFWHRLRHLAVAAGRTDHQPGEVVLLSVTEEAKVEV